MSSTRSNSLGLTGLTRCSSKPGLEHGRAIFLPSVAGQRDKIDPVPSRTAADLPGDLVTVDPRQANIDQGHVELLATNGLQPLLAVGGNRHLAAVEAEPLREHLAAVGVVFHDQDPRSGPRLRRRLLGDGRLDFAAQRQPDDEFAAAAGAVAAGGHRAAVQRDQRAHERQADPHAAVGAIERPIVLHEEIEDRVQHVRRNAGPRIADADHGLAALPLDAEPDRSFRRRVFGRVVQEIHLDLLQAGGIAHDQQRRGLDLDLQLLPPRLDHGAHRLHGLGRRSPQVDQFPVDLDLVLRDPQKRPTGRRAGGPFAGPGGR